MLRSILAVFLGYLVFMVLIFAFSIVFALALDGKLPSPDAAQGPLTAKICIAYVVAGWFFATAGGYVTAWVARRREVLHAAILAGVTLAIGVLYFVERLGAAERPEPVWYLVANIVLPIVSVPLGGMLRARHVRARGLGAEV